jgi:hypothetical protein
MGWMKLNLASGHGPGMKLLFFSQDKPDFFGWDEWNSTYPQERRVLGRSCVSFSHQPWPQQFVFFLFPFELVFVHSLFSFFVSFGVCFFISSYVFIFFLFALRLFLWFCWVFSLSLFLCFFFCVYSSCMCEGGGGL